MSTGSLVLLGLFIFWGLIILFFFLKETKGAAPTGNRVHTLRALFLSQPFFKPGVKMDRQKDLVILFIHRFGHLLFLVLLIRLALAPDPLSLGLMGVYAVGCGAYLVYALKSQKQVVSYRNLYQIDPDYHVLEITLHAEGAEKDWIGATLAELNLRKKELLVLAIIRGERFIVFPKGPEILTAGDRVLVFGKYPQQSVNIAKP